MNQLVSGYDVIGSVLEKKILSSEQKVIGIKNVEVVYIKTTLDVETIKSMSIDELKDSLLDLIPDFVRDIKSEIGE